MFVLVSSRLIKQCGPSSSAMLRRSYVFKGMAGRMLHSQTHKDRYQLIERMSVVDLREQPSGGFIPVS